jgi:hypothetical protein
VLRARDLTLIQDAEGWAARLRPGEDPDAATAGLNAALVGAGVRVFAIAPRARSLEGIYRSVSDGARKPETI